MYMYVFLTRLMVGRQDSCLQVALLLTQQPGCVHGYKTESQLQTYTTVVHVEHTIVHYMYMYIYTLYLMHNYMYMY